MTDLAWRKNMKASWQIIKVVVLSGGWILLGLSAWHFKERIFSRAVSLFSADAENVRWKQLVDTRKTDLRKSPWLDDRPQVLMLGDSHVEMGAWYNLFRGRFAIRNAGLSRAKIRDVTQLASELSSIKPEIVVCLCGINDLGSGSSAGDAYRDYLQLLEKITPAVTAERVIVLSVMPVTQNRLVDKNAQLNAKVVSFNEELRDYCAKKGFAYLDVWSALAYNEVLRKEVTSDGLHLNSVGYRKLAEQLEPRLADLYDKLSGN